MIKVIIVEDIPGAQKHLEELLVQNYVNVIEIVDYAEDVSSAIKKINQNSPELVFLDIKLGNNNRGGFDILNHFDKIPFHVIYTTALFTLGMEAFQCAGIKSVRFIVKPITKESLEESISHYLKYRTEFEPYSLKLGDMQEPEEIYMPTRTGHVRVKFESIVRIESVRNDLGTFTNVHYVTKDGEITKKYTSFGINKMYEMLDKSKFLRVHRQHIIRNKYIVSWKTNDRHQIIIEMDDKKKVRVAFGKTQEFREWVRTWMPNN